MTPYEELFNTAKEQSLLRTDERISAIQFAQNTYRLLVCKWGVPESRVRLFPPVGDFNPDMQYFPAGATRERPEGGWCFGLEVVFTETQMPSTIVLGPSTTIGLQVDFRQEGDIFTVEACGVKSKIQRDILGDYEAFIDELFQAVKLVLADQKRSENSERRIGFLR